MDFAELLDPIVQKALDYLCKHYQPGLIFLYGSFANNQQTATSDIDILCFAALPEFIHDSNAIDGVTLDAWIYPLAKLEDIVGFQHILPCRVLRDDADQAEELLAQLRIARAHDPIMTAAEREQHMRWLGKMFARASADTAEGNYRYHWLLFEFPESYCRLRGDYFDGPVKTLKRMAKMHPLLFAHYERLLAGEKSIALLTQIYAEINH